MPYKKLGEDTPQNVLRKTYSNDSRGHLQKVFKPLEESRQKISMAS